MCACLHTLASDVWAERLRTRVSWRHGFPSRSLILGSLQQWQSINHAAAVVNSAHRSPWPRTSTEQYWQSTAGSNRGGCRERQVFQILGGSRRCAGDTRTSVDLRSRTNWLRMQGEDTNFLSSHQRMRSSRCSNMASEHTITSSSFPPNRKVNLFCCHPIKHQQAYTFLKV